MTLSDNTKLNNSIKMLSVLSVAAMCFISILIYGAAVTDLAVFLIYALFYVQLPGLLILSLAKIDFGNFSTHIMAGFFTGWAFIIAQYFIFEFIGTDVPLYAIGPLCSAAFLLMLFKRKRSCPERNRYDLSFSRLSAAFCICIVLILLYALLNTQYLYLDPAECDCVYMEIDKAYHVGLINSLSHGYPLMSMWVEGRVIEYHIFSEILYAIPVRLFGMSADTIIMSCGPYLTAYLVGVSMYSFYNEFLKNKKYIGIYCLLTVLANTYITKELFSSWYFFHVFGNTNNFGFGISSCMIAVVTAKRYVEDIRQKKRSGKLLALLVILTMLVTGIKGPVAIVLVGGMWGTFILGLILRKVNIRAALPILLVTAGFMVIYVTILGMKGQSNGGGESFIAFATATDIAFFKGPLVAAMKAVGLPKIIRLGVVFAVFIIFLFTAFVLPFTVGYIRELYLVLTGKKAFDFVRVTVYASCLVGLIGLFILNYSGHSQVYFGFVTVAFAPLVSFWLFEDLQGNRSTACVVMRCIFCACILCTAFILLTYFRIGIDKAIDHTDPSMAHNTYRSISGEEYDAMIWLKENTPEDSLLATDRYYSVPLAEYSWENRWDNVFFLYPNYSNRFCYISGSGYNLPGDGWKIRRDMILINDKLFDPEYSDRDELAKDLGVDYVVVSKRFTDVPSLEDTVYKLCYSNDDVDIYEIK